MAVAQGGESRQVRLRRMIRETEQYLVAHWENPDATWQRQTPGPIRLRAGEPPGDDTDEEVVPYPTDSFPGVFGQPALPTT